MIARELIEMQANYQSLVDAVSAGSLSYDDAVNSLSHMRATDANGTVWSLDIDGNFLAGPAAGEAQLMDPYRFAERGSPGPWSQPKSNERTVSSEVLPNYLTNLPPIDEKQAKKSRKIIKRSAVSISDTSSGAFIFAKKYRSWIIVGLTILSSVLIWGSISKDSSPSIEIATKIESETPESKIIDSTIETKSEDFADLVTVADNLLESLGKKTAEIGTISIVEPGTGNIALLRHAQFVGYAETGLVLRAVSVEMQSKNSAQIAVNLLDRLGRVIISGDATMQIIDNEWLLTDWPKLG